MFTKTVLVNFDRSCALVHAGMAATGPALEFAEIKLGLEEFKNMTTAIHTFFEGHDLFVNSFSFELLKSMDMYRLQVINCRSQITHHRFVAIALR